MFVDPGYESLRHFESKVVEYDDSLSECTIFATDTGGEQQTTAWLTAREGSYVSACEMQ
ncbi:DUF7511 domain-containing protein [Haloarcula sp. GH36]|uniref:DUF7511 domain-containing protein n=1 Tax=Haloarcula montana TaxID=3111776 RepID=UPI002D779682|nr:hypothetical protein [Haloarcula sp. GH36]